MATKTYTVKHARIRYAKTNSEGKLLAKEKEFVQGDTIDLEDDEAEQLLEVGAIEEAPAEKTAKKDK